MKKLSAAILIFVLLTLTSCSKDIPELIEPQAPNDAYYTVDKGLVAAADYFDGAVTPVSKEYYFETEGIVDLIGFNVGDEIKSGDVLLTLNAGLEEKIADLKSELEQYETISSYYITQHELELDAMRRRANTLSGFDKDLYMVDIKETELNNTLFDDNRAAELLDIQATLSEYEDSFALSAIKADEDGRLAALGVLGEGESVNEGDLAAVLIEEDELFVQSEYLSSDVIDSLERVSVKVAGNTYVDPEYLPYTQDEIKEAKSFDKELYSRFLIDDELNMGDYAFIEAYYVYRPDVLRVPNEALYKDAAEGTSFVYRIVDGERVRVNVETGGIGDYYTEIISGLSAGDLIYYAEDAAVWGRTYKKTTAELGDYSLNTEFSSVDRLSFKSENLTAGVTGVIEEVYLEKLNDVYVTAETPLFSIKPQIAASEYEQAKLDYEEAEKDHEKNIQNYDKRISEKEQELSEAADNVSRAILSYELSELKDGREEYVTAQDERLAEAKDKYEKYELWQGGESVDIFAKYDGFLTAWSSIIPGMEVNMDDILATIELIDDLYFYVHDSYQHNGSLYDGAVRSGSAIRFSSGNDYGSYSSDINCLSAANILHEEYDNGIFIKPEFSEELKYVSRNYLSARYTIRELEDVVLIPDEYVFEEDNAFYVLLKEGDALVKREIVLGASKYQTGKLWIMSGLEAGDVVAALDE